jgi:uncharacterized protein involved in exopolysaccharide biosynthesis
MNLFRNYYVSLFWKRSPLIALVTVLFGVMSFFAAKQIPTEYEASAKLLVESAQIPDQLAMSLSTTGAQEQLEIIQQRLLTRANLLDIADKFEVFENRASMSADELVERMREKTTIQLTTGRDRATLMSLGFRDDIATTTADVVNEYVTLIQREDSRLRTSRASETEEFFKQEVERLGVDLEIKSTAIRDFRSANADALPETFAFRLERAAGLQETATGYTRDILILNEQRKQLVEAQAELARNISENDNETLTNEQEKLKTLREELVAAMQSGDETAPRVRILRSRITQVEQVIQSLGGQASGGDPTSSAAAQIQQIDAQIAFLKDQLETTEAQLSEIESTLDKTPGISVSLESLEREYENVQSQYNAAVSRLAVAQTSERIELASRGQRITVLEQATVPTDPSSPSSMLVMAAGTLLGAGAGIGLVILLELLNKTVRRPSDLVKALGITPIATLPYVKTQRERFMERATRAAILLAIIVGIPAALYAVHMLYLPLDLLADRMMNKFGV